jgi:hypothetical protein
VAIAKITKIEIVGSVEKITRWTDNPDLVGALGSCELKVEKNSNEINGIVSVQFDLKGQTISIL